MQDKQFNAVYAEYSQPLYNYVLWMTGNKAASDDILQTVFIRVWKSTNAPREEKPLRSWLYTICRNACYDFFRARNRSARFRVRYSREHSSSVDDGIGNSLIWRHLTRLQDTDRTIIYLHIRLGWGYADVAKLLKTTENNVRVRAFRALKKLRKLYTERV